MNTDFTSSRRELLKYAGCGFGSVALSSMAAMRQTPLIPPRAKRVIFLYLQGGPSQVDTFDYKPELAKHHEKEVEFFVPRTRQLEKRKVMKNLWDFKQHGQSGRWVSSIFPEVAKHVDDLCFIHSMHTEGVAHGPSTIFLHTGATNLIRPSMGAWISYGLGAENTNLPSFVTINPPATKGGPRNYGTAFLPANHQGTVLGTPGNVAGIPTFRNLTSPIGEDASLVEREMLAQLNQIQQNNSAHAALDGVLDSFELAGRMQMHAGDAVNFDRENQQTLGQYGIGSKTTDAFGRQCLAARQLAENGVRFIQVSHCDNSATPVWDQHSKMPRHEGLAAAVDKPISGLLTDLAQRGLLEDTLVWCGSEFGRTPFSQSGDGRDHNPRGFTVWLAGAGVKPGYAHGATDNLGFQAVENKVHMHDLHATILHLLGLDHEKLTFRYAGRDFRLTDVHGEVVKEILS